MTLLMGTDNHQQQRQALRTAIAIAVVATSVTAESTIPTNNILLDAKNERQQQHFITTGINKLLQQQQQNDTTSTSNITAESAMGSIPSYVPEHLATCRTYLAPSTIPGAGLGMFAGYNFKRGETVTTGDAIIPIRDLAWHNNKGDDGFSNTYLWGTFKLIETASVFCLYGTYFL